MRTFLVLFFMLSTHAVAADWKLFDKNGGVSSYIDRSSQRNEMTTRIAWLKSVHDKPQKLRKEAAGGLYVQKVELVHMDCPTRSYSIRKTVYSAKDGTPVGPAGDATDFQPVVPDSPSEVRYVAMCGKTYSAFDELRDKGIRYHHLPEPEPKFKWNPFAK